MHLIVRFSYFNFEETIYWLEKGAEGGKEKYENLINIVVDL